MTTGYYHLPGTLCQPWSSSILTVQYSLLQQKLNKGNTCWSENEYKAFSRKQPSNKFSPLFSGTRMKPCTWKFRMTTDFNLGGTSWSITDQGQKLRINIRQVLPKNINIKQILRRFSMHL